MGAYDQLSTLRISGIWDELKDVRQVSKDYRWVAGTNGLLQGVDSGGARIPIFNMLWGEINARFTDRITIAPIIGYNAQAPMKTLGPTLRMEQTNIPKIKHGALISEDTLIMIERITAALESGMIDNSATDEDITVFTNWIMNQVEGLAEGTLARLEHMAIGMLTGSYVYADPNPHGEMLNMTWQIPAEANVTPAQAWGDGSFGINHAHANATPISDKWAMDNALQQKYGVKFTRASMPQQILLYIFGTTEFQTFAPLFMARYGLAPSGTAVPLGDIAFMSSLLEAMWGVKIEIDDRTVMIEDNALDNWVAPPGTPAAGQFIRYHPLNQVIFTLIENDGNKKIFDVANAPVIEAKAGMVPGMIGPPFKGSTFGPFTYVTAQNVNGDPPGLVMYSVRNALARRKQLLCSAVMTVSP